MDGKVGGLKGGDLVMVRILGIGLVRGTVAEMQVQSIGPLTDEQSFTRQADGGRGWVGQIGEEHSFPAGSAGHGLDILHVEDFLRKFLVKDAGLDFK